MPKMEEIFKVEGEILHSSAKAVMFKINDESVWIPLSQLHEPEELFEDEVLRKGAHVEVKMTAWIAKKVGLI